MAILIPDKSYFKIGEVARLLNVEPYVLRYWEQEFKCLRLAKTSSQHRLYRRSDIETLALIKRLIHEEGFTVAGARVQIDKLTKDGQIAAIKASMLYTKDEPAQSAQVFGTSHDLMQAERSAMQAKIKSSQEQEQRLSQALAGVKKEHDQLKAQSANLGAECAELQREKRMLAAELAQKTQSIQNLLSQNDASSDFQQNLMNENESLNEDLRRLRVQLNETEALLDASNQTATSLRTDLKAINEQREMLREKIEEQQNQILIVSQTLEFSDKQLHDSGARVTELTQVYEKGQEAWLRDRAQWELEREELMLKLSRSEKSNAELHTGASYSAEQVEAERQRYRHLSEKFEVLQNQFEQLRLSEIESKRALVEEQHRASVLDTRCHALEQDLRESKRQSMLVAAQEFPERIATLQGHVHQAALDNKELRHHLQVEKHKHTALKGAIFEELFALHKAIEI